MDQAQTVIICKLIISFTKRKVYFHNVQSLGRNATFSRNLLSLSVCETVSSSAPSEALFNKILQYNPEDSTLYTDCHNELDSQKLSLYLSL
jgi:hypothetical protein